MTAFSRKDLATSSLTTAILATLFCPSSVTPGSTNCVLFLISALGIVFWHSHISRLTDRPQSCLRVHAAMSCLILASFWWQTPTTSGLVGGIQFVVLLACGAALGDLQESRADHRRLLHCTLAAAILLAVHALAQRFYLLDWLREAARNTHPDAFTDEALPFIRSRRARATFGQANGLGAFCAVTLPLAVAWSGGQWRRLWPSAVIVGALLASASAGGLLSTLLGLSILFAMQPGRPWRVGLITLIAAGSLAAGLVGINALGWIDLEWLERPSRTAPLRVDFWAAGCRAISDAWPSGLGLGGFEAHARDYAVKGQGFSRNIHNAYLTWIAEMGVLGVLMIAFVLGSLVRGRTKCGDTEATSESSGPRPSVTLTLAFCVALTLGFAGKSLSLFFVPGETAITHFALALAIGGPLLLFISWLMSAAEPRQTKGPSIDDAAFAGLIALAAHAFMDIDLHVPGLIAAAALAWALRGSRRRPQQSGPHEPLLLTIIIVGLSLAGAWVSLALGG